LPREAEVLAKIGRIATAKAKMEDLYDRFAGEIRKLIPFDRLSINLLNSDGREAHIAYVAGLAVEKKSQGSQIPLNGSTLEKAFHCRSGLIIHPAGIQELQHEFPTLIPNFREGLRSFLCIPLVYGDQEIGSLLLQRKKDRAFSQKDLRLAECLAYPISGAMAIARLVEQQRRMQEHLAQAQKMEALGTLAGGIAHDFNNILTAIIGCAELISLEVAPGSLIERNLQELLKASYRARDLVKQILAFSRRSEQERRPTPIDSLLREAMKLLRASLPSTIEIRSEIEASGGVVLANPVQIHQVVMNLCTNSAQAMEEKGGTLTIGLQAVEIDADRAKKKEVRPGRYLCLSVKDTGKGIPPEIREKIFDPYFTTKEVGKGTGLGLAVVQGIVKGHGGFIEVSSEVGRGATFEVFFPLVDGVEGTAEVKPSQKVPLGRRERILFVDDEPALVEVGRQMLERLGYEAEVRTQSLEALELFAREGMRFDLVITDMTMPGMTGDRLSQELLRIRPDIPIILCTGYSERISSEEARKMGICQLLLKPLVMQELAETIRRALDQPPKN
jgi:signal transduction histidine kinase/ActR/RegA family two-component response regulator